MKMTEQYATAAMVSAIMDPENNYTWWDADNNERTRRDFREAVEQDAAAFPRLVEAAALADWKVVMAMVKAAGKAYYKAAGQ